MDINWRELGGSVRATLRQGLRHFLKQSVRKLAGAAEMHQRGVSALLGLRTSDVIAEVEEGVQ